MRPERCALKCCAPECCAIAAGPHQIRLWFNIFLRNLTSPPILTRKAGLSPLGAPTHDHGFETVTPDVRAPLKRGRTVFRHPPSHSALHRILPSIAFRRPFIRVVPPWWGDAHFAT